MTSDDARNYLEQIRWPNGVVCPHCESTEITRLHGKAHRKGTIQCNDCREQFTVTVNTVMESSKIPLNKWILAFHLLCSSKKGFSALQLQRELGLGSYRTAWFMAHRIRFALDSGPLADKLKGTVEVDETYVGGKGKSKTGRPGIGGKKTPVIGLVERNGNIKAMPIERVTSESLKGEIRKHVDISSTIITDQFRSYHGIGKEFAGGHKVINHAKHQFSYKGIHTNNVESFWGLLKRGHYGTYHSMSKAHLGRYCSEFVFRWNHRKLTDAQRTQQALSMVAGKRLMYRATQQTKSHGI